MGGHQVGDYTDEVAPRMDVNSAAEQTKPEPAGELPSEWCPNGLMEEAIAQWHRALPKEAELMYLNGISRLKAWSPLQRWSLCAGSGLASRFYKALSNVLAGRYLQLAHFLRPSSPV